MREKILGSAIVEFSEKTYNDASINSICKRANISKGIIYHYFKNKDELALTCFKQFFDDLVNYLNNNYQVSDRPVNDNFSEYFIVREEFFNINPLYLKLYYNITNNPTDHLKADIRELRYDFDKLNEKYLFTIIDSLNLRPNIDSLEAMEIFKVILESIHIKNQLFNNKDERESYIKRWLSIFLYGIVKRKEDENE